MLKPSQSLKELLDELVEKYETVEFIYDDPIQFPHRYRRVEDIEIAGFLASMFAFGNRKAFISKLEQLFGLFGESPYKYVLEGDFDLGGLNYRFLAESDIIAVLEVLKVLYKYDGGLAGLFERAVISGDLMGYVCEYFYSHCSDKAGAGFYFAIPNPKKGGAMKRMWMFLRWMVRKSEVDLGVWNFISTAQLCIPLDVHVARISRHLGLLKRNANDKKAVEDLTAQLRLFDCQDPVKYDFALFGYGVNNG